MNSFSLMLASVAILSSPASDVSKAGRTIENADVAAAAPRNGDWSTIVTKTPEGGFVMGNPNAKVKLVEFVSLTCDHCAEFDRQGGKALVNDYVKKGLVSLEVRNFVRDPLDMAAALLARCGKEASFFGLTRDLLADQGEWIGKLQAAGPTALEALQGAPPEEQFSKIAELGGLRQYASVRGVSGAQADQCLLDQAEVAQLIQMTSDAASTYNVPGTPSFLINGTLVDHAHNWPALEPKIKEALAS